MKESFCVQGMWGKAILDKINLMIDRMRIYTRCDYDDIQILAGEDAYHRILSVVDYTRRRLYITPFEQTKLTFMDVEILLERNLRYDEIIVMKKPFTLGRDFLNKLEEEDMLKKLKIKKVIYNAPATIVYWEDGTRTVVKCSECNGMNDCSVCCECHNFDKEKGLAMAMCKRMADDKGNYNDIFRKWCK